ncbi:MAG: winged helix-turn-helix domain-containing protein, partial [Candidatus Heimdallarchaeota archaeon]
TSITDTIYQNDDETLELTIKINPNIVEELRLTGIDGILICLYLLKHRDSFCSVKRIQKDLHIPKSTVYRNIQKLVEMQYVNTQNSLDDPGKTYYRIAYEGEALIYDFYDLLHLPGRVSQPVMK